MSAYKAWARDHVARLEGEHRHERDDQDDRKDRELTDAAVRDIDDLWGVA